MNSTESCRYLLATSSVFEPYIPASHHDILRSLSMLGQLGQITEIYLQEHLSKIKEQEKCAEKEAQNASAAKAKSEATESKASSDQTLVQALLKLRNSDTFKRRGYRKSSIIIRQTPWNPQ